MNINTNLLNKFIKSKSSLLAVSKYLDKENTQKLIQNLEKDYPNIIVWFWENRVASLKIKKIDKNLVHFIWNIQSKEIKEILKYCWVIHSVCNIKHLKKINDICFKQDSFVKIFLQINVDSSKSLWINISEVPEYLKLIQNLENISLIWFSSIWKREFTREEKIKEFDTLINLKNKYIPNWLISAWTSKDYEIALEKKIDIIRIGTLLYNN